MVLLPVAAAIAVAALLVILRRERHRRESGDAVSRPFYVTLALVALLAMAAIWVIGATATALSS